MPELIHKPPEKNVPSKMLVPQTSGLVTKPCVRFESDALNCTIKLRWTFEMCSESFTNEFVGTKKSFSSKTHFNERYLCSMALKASLFF